MREKAPILIEQSYPTPDRGVSVTRLTGVRYFCSCLHPQIPGTNRPIYIFHTVLDRPGNLTEENLMCSAFGYRYLSSRG